MTRRMTMTPLEPRTAGGLKGWGFTVRFDEPAANAAEDGPEGKDALLGVNQSTAALSVTDKGGVTIPHQGAVS